MFCIIYEIQKGTCMSCLIKLQSCKPWLESKQLNFWIWKIWLAYSLNCTPHVFDKKINAIINATKYVLLHQSLSIQVNLIRARAAQTARVLYNDQCWKPGGVCRWKRRAWNKQSETKSRANSREWSEFGFFDATSNAALCSWELQRQLSSGWIQAHIKDAECTSFVFFLFKQ